MLLRFFTDSDLSIKIYGEYSSGSVRTTGGRLAKDRPYGNISYAELARLRNGVIDWNEEAHTGTILAPDDPRALTAPFPKNECGP